LLFACKDKNGSRYLPRKGPLAGIYSGLRASSSSQAIIVGCDTPFLNVSLLAYMAKNIDQYDVVLPRIGEMVEPLCAVYSKSCLVSIKALLEQNKLRVSKLFGAVKVRYIEEGEINIFDPEHLSFFNINSQADLEKAKDYSPRKRIPLR